MPAHIILLFISSLLVLSSHLLAQSIVLKGKVKFGGEPLEGVTVALENRTTVTDDNGIFSFFVSPGNYVITITYSGYKKIEQDILIDTINKNYFEFDLMPNDRMEEVVLLGSRSLNPKTNLTSTIPVDVFSTTRLAETGQISLTQMLNVSAPSFNASREVLNEPATLRGLDPDHVLILVNGVRYHNMAWLFAGNLGGQLGRGSAGNDLNSIPFPAVDKIEILRDGAAAQYGSDAIAGVINIRIKKNTGKTSIQLHTGQYYKGDGTKFSLGLNRGFVLNKSGFVNLSFSHRYQAPTYRGGEYRGTVYYDTTGATAQQKEILLALDAQKVADSGFNRKTVVDNAGSTKLISDGFLLNGGYSLRNHKEIFLVTSVNSRKLDRLNAYRFPKDKSRVNFILFPNGFQPHGKSNTVDIMVTAGIKSVTKKQWHWNYTSSYGVNWVDNHLTNANNASQTYILGANAPTSFYTGRDVYKQITNNINFTRRFSSPAVKLKSFNLGLGAEWRIENYHSKIGEEASWYNYDPAHYSQGGVGSGGPENAVNKSRNVIGTYVEVEPELSDHFLINIAGRYEYYSDFGGNMAAKFATRYKFSEHFLMRASVNNGFRAPSLQQRYFKSIQNSGTNSGGALTIITRGIFPNDDEVIRAIGIPLLTAEKTLNVSGGFALSLSNILMLTADAYWIQIKNRIVLSGMFDRKTGTTLDSILDMYPQFNAISRVSFFSNAINTRTKGIDIVMNAHCKAGEAKLQFNVGANFNSTHQYGEIRTSDKLSLNDENSNTILSTEEKTKIEKSQPNNKIILFMIYERAKTKVVISNTRFGKTTIAPLVTNPTKFIFESFSPKVLTDINFAYSFTTWITVTAGVNNLFNVYPDRLKNYENTSQGSWIYSPEASPFGFNGGYYFVNLNFNF